MRTLFGALAVLLGLASICLTARYGYKSADTVIDGVISAVVFGSIALCAFLFDAAAVRLWFMKHRVGSALIGFIAAAALIVTFSNSLGSIVSRTDAVLAQRQGVAESRADNRRELLRLEKALADLGRFAPADWEAVKAAKRAADTAASNKIAECDKRGPNCRQRELDEAAAATNLATVTAAKTATERARQLETDIAAVKAKLTQPANTEVGTVNPLGTALANLIGSAADVLTSWQQAIVALVFELCLVGVMVIYELLGHSKLPAREHTTTEVKDTPAATASIARSPSKAPSKPIAPKPVAQKAVIGSVSRFISENVSTAKDARTEMRDLIRGYRDWCATEGLRAIDLNKAVDEVESLCSQIGIQIEVAPDQRVYCLGATLKPSRVEGLSSRS
jgi:hypothetical protein